MTDERLKQIDEDAIKGILPKPFTVQAMVAEIRILMRTINEQREVIKALKSHIAPPLDSQIINEALARARQ